MNNIKIADDWRALLADEFEKPYFLQLQEFVDSEYSTREVFPKKENIFRAFDSCALDKLKVVILGQDPYHGDNQANGLCFSVQPGVKYPPSLVNIFKEVAACGYTQTPENGDLARWSEQGVLLLNSVLTVRAHSAASHAKKGWERFTDAVISEIGSKKTGIVYMLWGSYAINKCKMIDSSKNLILTSVHPSPLSAYRGFLGCRHFEKANEYLTDKIEW